MKFELSGTLAVLKELADDLEAELNHRYGGMLDYPSMKRRYDRDMEPVRRARDILLAAEAARLRAREDWDVIT